MIHSLQQRALGTLAATLAVLVTIAALHAVAAHAARPCSPPKYPGSGYFTSLMVNKANCSTGDKVTLAHYRCRIKHGLSGRCTQRVMGFSCSEKRTTIQTEFDSRVTCDRGVATVVYTYQQNT